MVTSPAVDIIRIAARRQRNLFVGGEDHCFRRGAIEVRLRDERRDKRGDVPHRRQQGALYRSVDLVILRFEGEDARLCKDDLANAVDRQLGVLTDGVVSKIQKTTVGQGRHEVVPSPHMPRLQVVSEENTRDRSRCKFAMGLPSRPRKVWEEIHEGTEGDVDLSPFVAATVTSVPSAIAITNVDVGGVAKELRTQGPETRREPGTLQERAGAPDDVLILSFDQRVSLVDVRRRFIVHRSEGSSG